MRVWTCECVRDGGGGGYSLIIKLAHYSLSLKLNDVYSLKEFQFEKKSRM